MENFDEKSTFSKNGVTMSSTSEFGFEISLLPVEIRGQTKILRCSSSIRTYNAVHMPTAHMNTDGCEALSAFRKRQQPRKFDRKS